MKIVEDLDPRSVSLVTTPTAFAKSSLSYVQFIGHYYANPGYSIEREKLDSYLLVCTLKGTGYLRYQGKSYRLGRGAIFLIDCKEYHLYYSDFADLWEFAWVHFDGRPSGDYADYFMKHGGPVIEMLGGEAIADSIMAIYYLQGNMDERSDLLSASQLVNLLTSLLLMAMQEKGQAVRIPVFIKQVKLSLENRFQSGINLDDLTREFAVSKYHLSREFKKYTGYSPYEYVVNLRMKAAKELLKTTDLSIEQITTKVGFSNTTHFIHMFRNREGTTPLQFRKVWQGI